MLGATKLLYKVLLSYILLHKHRRKLDNGIYIQRMIFLNIDVSSYKKKYNNQAYSLRSECLGHNKIRSWLHKM